MHYVLESAIEEKCRCGNPASHKVEEVFDLGKLTFLEAQQVRHPLTVYLCCKCFSLLMGAHWCNLPAEIR